jgi:hypothetical protein
VDWLFNLYCAQFGRLGHLKKPLSVYRQHQGGAWSGRPTLEKAVELWNLIAEYNSFLDYQYDQGLQQYKRKLLASLSEHSSQVGKFDVVVFDDVFPSPRSGFRLAEFTAYLNELPTSLVVTSGSALPVLGATPLPELIHAFQRRHPEIGNRVLVDDGTFPLRLARLVYVDFLTNAYALLPAVEEAQVPFAFTLYPGAGFALDDVACERRLKRVFASPCFQKVVVTQPVTHHYLVSKRLCPVEKIEMIWGVVMPQHTVASSAARPKKRWGFGKSRLDICFMAHRYMAHGEDKGFDVFVNTAALLRKRHEDIYFHVIGPYNAVVLDVSMIADRLEFHGPLDPEEFDTVLHNMDMIISPNISGKLGRGSFDGFPTASCIEAGLRGCAIFAVDEFNSGAGRFVDGEDIVLLVYDLQSIVERVESYYHDPALLRAVGEKGRLRILQLYSQQAQVAPRVRMLRDLLKDSFAFDAGKLARLGLVGRRGPRPKSRLEQAISRYLPERFKRLCRGYLGYIWRR